MYGSALVTALLSSSAVLALPVPTRLAPREADAATQLANAQQAQALNAKFATLTASSSCTNDETACVQGKVSQCVNGQLQVGSACAGGTQCVALPLVNSAGTSVTCDTEADAIARIQAAGGSASLTGSGSSASSSSGSAAQAPAAQAPAAAAAPAGSSSTSGSTTTSSSSSNFQLLNAQDAQALNTKFQTLTADSACTNDEQACVNGQFAQCVGGKFQVGSSCAGGTQCFALPLVNSRGTSVTCDTEADAVARMQAAGASASVTRRDLYARAADAATQLANAQQAQAQNAKFATLTADSTCSGDEQGCVNGNFAQCVGGKFQVGSSCAGGTQCVALPLVNSAGTSVTCDTEADAVARIQAAGGSASLTGSGSTGSSSSGSTSSTSGSSSSGSSAQAPAAAAQGGSSSSSGSTTASSSGSSSSSNFQLLNAQDAQALNAKFQTLTASSSCTNDEQACVNGQFAQCVGGKFQVGSSCAGGTQCFALPLVNSRGTSVTCDTEADAVARMQAAGASASITGGASASGSTSSSGSGAASGSTTASTAGSDGSDSSDCSDDGSDATGNASGATASTGTSSTASQSSGSTSSASGNFQLSNAQQAQAQNAKFATLTASSSCTEGEEACVGGNFAQCVGGKFQVSSSCSGGTQCVALPLVNSAGTSVTCDTQADAIARMQAAGASASLTG